MFSAEFESVVCSSSVFFVAVSQSDEGEFELFLLEKRWRLTLRRCRWERVATWPGRDHPRS